MKYKNIIRTMQDGFWYVDTDGRFLDVNDAACKMLGYERGELIKMKISDIEAIEDEADVIRHIAKMRDAGGDCFETKHKRKDGTIVEVEATTSFIKDADNERIFVFVRDITARARMDELILSLAEQQQTILDASRAMIFYKDKENRFIRVNNALAKVSGMSKQEMEGKTMWDFYSKEAADHYWQDDKEVMASGNPRLNIIESMETPQGTIWVQTDKIPYRDLNGNIIGIIGFSLDITEHKKTEKTLQQNEERYRKQFEEAIDAIFLADLGTGMIVDCNIAASKLIEREKSEIIGKYQSFLHPTGDIKNGLSKTFKSHMTGESSELLEDKVIAKSGQIKDVAIRASKLTIEGKEVMQGIFRDITEHKKAEEVIIREKLLSDSIVNNMPAGIAFLDNDFILRQCNHVYADLIRKYTPYTPEQALGMSYYDYVPGSRPQVEAWFQNVSDLAVVDARYGFELTLQRDGQDEKTYWNTSVAPVLDPAGKVDGILILTQDVTERKRLEEQLKDIHEMRVFGQLAAGVAHEVRNPLNAILAIAEALFQDIGDNPEFLPYLYNIRDQVERLSILMKDLLEIGKPVSYDSFQTETVAGIVSSTIDLWSMLDLSKKYVLRYISHPESEKLYVKTEIARLQQVVLNLLQNASQNSPEGSEIVIHVLEPTGKTVNIHIIDRGTGIPPDNLKHVFDPFFTTRKGGSGLGLSIVKHFVESMGGEVAIWNNDPPPGCTVELRLPIATDSES